MLEADVILRGQGTENQTDIPVMAHPPATDSDITLEEWLERVLPSPKGMKLDFKGTDVLEPSMVILQRFKEPFAFRQPFFLNADIFNGPNSPGSQPVDPNIFRDLVLQYFPESTLSVGWTTSWPGEEGYTQEMVDEMADYIRDLNQPITLPIRAAFVRRSWEALSGLLAESRSYSLTIWSGSSDLVNPDDLVYVRENADPDKIYYDLPDWLMDAFLDRLNETTVAV